MIQRTFSIIKPDATERNLTGAINARIEAAGFRIIAQKRILMTVKQAEQFYAVHQDKSFFADLVQFMCSAPIVVQVLEKEEAVSAYRALMGKTDPKEAAAGTLRAEFGETKSRNSVHGSDSIENAAIEIAQFFSGNELVG